VQVLSIKYSLCPILKFIIPSRSPVVETSINDTININQMKENPLLYWVHPQILIRVHIWRVEPILHIDNCLQSLFKARQCLSLWWVHHFCQDQYFFLVFSYSFEPLEEVFFEVFEEEGAFASKYTHVVAKKGIGFSNSNLPPGALESKNPKSMWKMLPVFLSSRIFPLCLSFI